MSAGQECKITKELDGKTVIVTGANGGIGSEIALELVRRGARVILACRDALKGESIAANIVHETGSKNLVIQQLDLASVGSIHRFVNRVTSQEAHIDILINNAGVAWCPEGTTEDGFETHFGVNYLGHFLLTSLLMNSLKKSTPSRVINVVDDCHKNGEINFDNVKLEGCYDAWKAYSQSKLALVMFTGEFRRRFAGTGVTCLAADPGIVSTDLHRQQPYLYRATSWVWSFLGSRTPREGAQTILHCALLDPEEVGGNSASSENGDIKPEESFYYKDCKRVEPPPKADDRAADERLWELSEDLLGLK